MLNVLRLSRSALDLLLEISRTSGYTERRLRPILSLPTEEEQVAALERMLVAP